MSWTSADDMARHRNWLDKQLTRPKGQHVPTFEQGQTTYVIRVSRPWTQAGPRLADIVETAIAESDYKLGADVLAGAGIWNGESEDSATVIIQTDDITSVLAVLAGVHGIRWAHCEEHIVPTSYVDLDKYR